VNTLIKAAYGQFDTASAVPTEFTLLRAGFNEFVDGKLLFDDEAAQSVMKRYQARGLELMADYEHQSLSVPPVVAPASAKRWTPELRNGDLVAANIQWTEKAAAMIAAGEYRYWSVACRVDPKTMRVVEVVNFGLTNTPAANGIQPLMAASITGTQPEESQNMKTVLVALGLSADMEESVAIVEAARFAELKRDILALTGKASVAEALGVLRAQQQSHEQVVALNAKVAQLEADKRAQEFDALVKQGEADAKISPAMAKGEWIAQLRGKVDGCEQLRAFLATAPKLAQSVAEAPKETAPSGDPELTADEIAVAKRFCAEGDIEALEARLNDIKALKRRDKKAA
jgi:phage I-like protein